MNYSVRTFKEHFKLITFKTAVRHTERTERRLIYVCADNTGWMASDKVLHLLRLLNRFRNSTSSYTRKRREVCLYQKSKPVTNFINLRLNGTLCNS